MLSVGVLAEVVEVGSDTRHELLAHGLLGNIEHLLDDVVGELVLHHGPQHRVRVGGRRAGAGWGHWCGTVLLQDLVDEELTLVATGIGHSLLHNVAGELVC